MENEEIVKLLNDYYEECKTSDEKEDIARFVVHYYEDIKKVMKENNF